MKKVLIAYAALVIIVIALAFAKFNGTTEYQRLETRRQAPLES